MITTTNKNLCKKCAYFPGWGYHCPVTGGKCAPEKEVYCSYFMTPCGHLVKKEDTSPKEINRLRNKIRRMADNLDGLQISIGAIMQRLGVKAIIDERYAIELEDSVDGERRAKLTIKEQSK